VNCDAKTRDFNFYYHFFVGVGGVFGLFGGQRTKAVGKGQAG